MTVNIRGEMRDEGDGEIWVNLGDVLKWLDELPTQANSPIAAGVASEIRTMLYDYAVKGMDDAIERMPDDPESGVNGG